MTENIPALSTIQSKGDSKKFELLGGVCNFRVCSSIKNLSMDWEKAQPPHNIYLHRPILTAIEDAPPKGILPTYLIFYKNKRPIGLAYCQVTNFKTEQGVQDMEGKKNQLGFLKTVRTSIKSYVAKKLEFNLLVCGNLLFTGEHGYYFHPGEIERTDTVKLVEEALQKTLIFWNEKKVKIDGLFIKDLSENQIESCKQLTNQGFNEFLFHPNMVLKIRPKWETFDDYMQAISSKYRVRVKKAFKCGKHLEKVIFTEEQLKKNVDRLYELYKGVMDTAGFNMVVLNESYIIKLKEHLGDDFRVTGYYYNGELIGYRTNINNFSEMEAHFLGYDQSYNRELQLYMNMLLDSLRQGIEQKNKEVVFARTAMEIKSSIGAEPQNMFCFIRANGKVLNKVLSPILEYFRPDDNWIQRRPFKEY